MGILSPTIKMSSHVALLFLFVNVALALNCQVCEDEAYAGMCVDQYDNGASKECPLGTVCAYFKDDISVDVIDGDQFTEYHRMCDTDPGRQCIVNEEWHSVRCYCNTDNCNADEKCDCDDSTTTTQVPETTSITDGATNLTLSMSVFIASMIIRNF